VTGDQLPDSHPGACAVADVVDAKGRLRFTAVSLYGQGESIADGRIYSWARLHRMISDLTGVFVTARQRRVILAGDFNVTTQISDSSDVCVASNIRRNRTLENEEVRNWKRH
jgi:hypothetical protein